MAAVRARIEVRLSANVIRAEGNRAGADRATGADRAPKRVLESSKRITTIRRGNEEQVHHPRRPITREGRGEEFSGVLADALCLQDRYFLSISSVPLSATTLNTGTIKIPDGGNGERLLSS